MSSFPNAPRSRGPRARPVIVLADISGSMSADGKIQALNLAIRLMLDHLKHLPNLYSEVHAAVIAFGDPARLVVNLQPARTIEWEDLVPGGPTATGAAIDLAREMIEDQSVIDIRSYRPSLLLITDGAPTDDWREALDRLEASPRGSQVTRIAMGIGREADLEMLRRFHNHPRLDILHAEGVDQIGDRLWQIVDLFANPGDHECIAPRPDPTTDFGPNMDIGFKLDDLC